MTTASKERENIHTVVHDHEACACGNEHDHGHEACACGHDHEHGHEVCACGHDHEHGHDHDHDHEACACGHDHGHETCACGHDHGHDHEHDHDACACGHDRDHDHGACACGHDHGHAHGHAHAHAHEACACGHDHEHGHDHDHSHAHCDCCQHTNLAPDRELSAEPTFAYSVLGVDCPSCALSVQNAVRGIQGVEDARLVYATATLEVVAEAGADVLVLKREVLSTVRSCGEDLKLTDAERAELNAERSWFAQNREVILMGLSAFCLVAGLICDHLMGSEQRAIPFYVAAAVSGLVYIMPMAIASLRRGTADMNVLMSIAVIGALIMGFGGDESVFGDAALVIFLDQVGEWLEGWSMRKTSSSVRDLMDLAPDVAHVVGSDGTATNTRTKDVQEGDTIRVLPGERVPLDGTIVTGRSSFNEAPVTGESVPKDKGEGDEVYAGTLNANAVVDVVVTAVEDCTTLARIVSQVQGAQAEKAPYESFVNRFAASYTPIVVAGAAVLGIVAPLFIGFTSGTWSAEVWHDWVYRACSLLVVACPCALVISTPVSFVSALTCAARNGILVKGGGHFDVASRVTHIAFDKTGTLTTGHPSVTRVVALNGASEDEVLTVAAALETSSTHPLARAIVECASIRELKLPIVENAQEIAANGVTGRVDGMVCAIGKLAYAKTLAPEDASVDESVERLGATGATALVVVRDGAVMGVVGVADTLRESATEALANLRGGHGEPERTLEMLTGDNAHVAAQIAEQAGLTSVQAELLPGQKLDRIAEVQDAGGMVAMVGDGINDAPALAKANLGITMGAAASDTALEVADVALLADELDMLPLFFRLATRAMNVVRENIAFAIGVKVLVFVLVAMGIAGMGAAVFADTGVALIVVLNGMRLMRNSRLIW